MIPSSSTLSVLEAALTGRLREDQRHEVVAGRPVRLVPVAELIRLYEAEQLQARPGPSARHRVA